MRQAAVVAYVGHGGGDGSAFSMFSDTSSITQVMGAQHYLDSVNAHWDDSIAKLDIAKAHADDDRRQLLAQQDGAQKVLDLLTRARADASAAITAQNATLTRVRVRPHLVVDHREASEGSPGPASGGTRDRGRARGGDAEGRRGAGSRDTHSRDAGDAAQGPAAQPTPPPVALPPPKPVTGGGYANPLRSTGGLTPERIDSGVDFAGSGPVYAVGNGVVLNVYASDWPGGTFIAYRLSDGPAAGLVVYTAEDLNPQVAVGAAVTANTVIGQMYGGPHGIEMGWADGARLPNAMARSAGQYHGGNSTAFGANFSRFLQALGAPGGVLEGNPTGTLPPGWPQW